MALPPTHRSCQPAEVSTSQQVAAVFSRVADTYDAVGIPWFTPIAAGLVEALDPRPGERVLDIGTGRGAALRPLAEAVGPDGTVLGIDVAERMVELTAQDVAHLSHVEVRVADASAPGLPAASYDVVCASLVAFFMPDPQAALSTWASLVAPGGRLGISTFDRQDQRWETLDALFRPYLPPQMLDARTSGRAGPFGSDAGVAGLLEHAGLVDVLTHHTTIEVVLESVEQWERFGRSHGQRAMWDQVPEDEQEEVRRRASTLLDGWGLPVRLDQDVRYTLGRRG